MALCVVARGWIGSRMAELHAWPGPELCPATPPSLHLPLEVLWLKVHILKKNGSHVLFFLGLRLGTQQLNTGRIFSSLRVVVVGGVGCGLWRGMGCLCQLLDLALHGLLSSLLHAKHLGQEDEGHATQDVVPPAYQRGQDAEHTTGQHRLHDLHGSGGGGGWPVLLNASGRAWGQPCGLGSRSATRATAACPQRQRPQWCRVQRHVPARCHARGFSFPPVAGPVGSSPPLCRHDAPCQSRSGSGTAGWRRCPCAGPSSRHWPRRSVAHSVGGIWGGWV